MDSDEELVSFQTLEDAQQAIARDRENLIFVGFGVNWCYPAKKNLQNLWAFGEDTNSHKKCNQLKGLRIFLVNQDKCKQYCSQNGMIVGVPTCTIFFKGKQMS
eukprot:TRINITY_DN2550_c0_g1_i4.p1 TRINITY_DN2550_c0_g1~~TRINITY_DN2550_c0_g1_i4.p1  ORF type:complete len:103 (+),score=17.90 TRINITY_DN2550_c0_g1_i4:45-353(+)